MSDYSLTRAAERDMLDIVSYIATDNPAAAQRMKVELFEAFAALAETPGMGHSRPDVTQREVKFWSVRGRYSIVYRERRQDIQILRVAGPGRDVGALLGG